MKSNVPTVDGHSTEIIILQPPTLWNPNHEPGPAEGSHHGFIGFSQERAVADSNSPVLKMRQSKLRIANGFLKVTQPRSAEPKSISPRFRTNFLIETVVKMAVEGRWAIM